MEMWDAIRARRNVRAYEDRPIPKEHLDRILEAAWRTPSSMNEQPWDFVLCTERETLQQLAMARIRAVESNRAVVVASTTGVSAIIAPDGRLIAHSGTWQRAVLEARVPLVSQRTLADRIGAWPQAVIVALTLAALAWAAAALRRRRTAAR